MNHAASSAERLRIGGLARFSTVDWPGRLACVVFVQGCPWRCGYCHNPHLQPRDQADGPGWPALRDWLETRRGLLDGIVFSGGEPTIDPALGAAIREAREAGFAVGLHTAGIYPARLADVLPDLDWVGLDIKALPEDYEAVTRIRGSAQPAWESLRHLAASGVAFECRTTLEPGLFDDASLLALADKLVEFGTRRYALQAYRPVQDRALTQPPFRPSPAVLAQLAERFEQFEFRE
ncbi:anaerobic ribonucleoside-triphosphate reductase activating protein [Chitinivorax sp. PXF-14]|uniref:anaerobic ribonucleoside-triphosphate reductase activating protein n=1 Tax=Chitinivorax sp. PXF-14 TaxID=3230488 RepID=UPI0034650283